MTDLASAVTVIADRLGKWFEEAWDAANYLHVWGSMRLNWMPNSSGGGYLRLRELLMRRRRY